jgi:hypothetical protein
MRSANGVVWLLVGLTAIGAIAFHVASPVNHDAAWILEGAARLLAGGRFGVDVIDVNPPLAWWVALAPAAVARVTEWPVAVTAAVFVGLLGAGALATAIRLLPRERAWRQGRAGLALVGIYLLLIMPGYDFGQREHLMAILGLPYILLRGAERPPPAAAAFAIGLAGGLGFCLKPYFLLVPLGIEAWRWLRTRKAASCIAPETIAMALFGTGYAAAVVQFAPAYLHDVVPAALAGYWAYDNPFIPVFREIVTRAAPGALAAAVIAVTVRRGVRLPPQAQALLVAGTMAALGALIQMKGWRYHLLPTMLFLSFGACLACITPVRTAAGRLMRVLALALALIGCWPSSSIALRAPASDGGTAATVAGLTDAFRHHAKPGGTVFGLVTSPRDVHPAVLAAGVRWAAPFCCMYLMPGLIRADEAPPAKRAAAEAAGRAQLDVALGIVRDKAPSVIAVDEAAVKLGFGDRRFDYLRWLDGDPRWAAELSRYRDAGTVGHFRLLVRN